ncbi:MAG: Ig-like domain-containing protein [Clostridia bacterium]|nr:Ig-like domain-containing protein [Clostridia bacterium]
MKKLLSLILCLLLMTTMLAACGDDKQEDTNGDSTASTTTTTVTATPESTTTTTEVSVDTTTEGTHGTTAAKPTTGTTDGPTICPTKPVQGKNTIAQARAAKAGASVEVTGVVARITYAFGMKPAGAMLVDDTGSIYVYDSNIASQVKVGNTVTIKGTKAFWILDTEMDNAQKFGYKGCNQIDSATLIANDGKTAAFSKKGIVSTTVKAIMDTPVDKDITSQIFKVTALVKKVPGNGFTNYYINDLDGTTGTYVYTQCNGSDFSWLDKFDGKICTVYVTALNAKSSSAGCVWRFLPIEVKDEGFNPSSVNIAEHVVKYYGLPQFLTSYTGDPAMELLSTVSGDLLNYKDAKLTYASDNTKVATVSGNVLHCLSTGKVTITVTGSYGGKTYSGKITLNVTINKPTEQFPTVAEAIAAKVGDAVTVKGIVGPSLVNKTGFYLIDKSGVIAVETTAAVMETIEIGHEVVIEAKRGINTKDKDYGQTCLKEAAIKTNYFGKHDYPTDAFKGEITVADFYALNVNTDYTTHVYTMTATVSLQETAYYTSLKLTDGTNSITLYSSSANQYGWLKAYAGQEITVEIAPCNWNSKNYYAGCVLAVINADGSKTYNTLNFDN